MSRLMNDFFSQKARKYRSTDKDVSKPQTYRNLSITLRKPHVYLFHMFQGRTNHINKSASKITKGLDPRNSSHNTTSPPKRIKQKQTTYPLPTACIFGAQKFRPALPVLPAVAVAVQARGRVLVLLLPPGRLALKRQHRVVVDVVIVLLARTTCTTTTSAALMLGVPVHGRKRVGSCHVKTTFHHHTLTAFLLLLSLSPSKQNSSTKKTNKPRSLSLSLTLAQKHQNLSRL